MGLGAGRDAPLAVPPGIDTHGTGMLKDEGGDLQPLSLRRYCQLMIEVSDNVATDTVLHALGTERVNALLDECSLDAIRCRGLQRGGKGG